MTESSRPLRLRCFYVHDRRYDNHVALSEYADDEPSKPWRIVSAESGSLKSQDVGSLDSGTCHELLSTGLVECTSLARLLRSPWPL